MNTGGVREVEVNRLLATGIRGWRSRVEITLHLVLIALLILVNLAIKLEIAELIHAKL